MADLKGKLHGWIGNARIVKGTEKQVGVTAAGDFDSPAEWEPGWYRLVIEHGGREIVTPAFKNTEAPPVFRFTGDRIVKASDGGGGGGGGNVGGGGPRPDLDIGFTDYAALGRSSDLLARDYEKMAALGWVGVGPRVWGNWSKVPGCAVIGRDGRIVPGMRQRSDALFAVCLETTKALDFTLGAVMEESARLAAMDSIAELASDYVQRGLRLVVDICNEAEGAAKSDHLVACLKRGKQLLRGALWTVSYSNFKSSPGHIGPNGKPHWEDPSNEGRWEACQKVRGLARRGFHPDVYAWHFPRGGDWHEKPAHWYSECSAHMRDRWQDGPAPLERPLYFQEDRRVGDQRAGGQGADPTFDQFVTYFRGIQAIKRGGANVYGACFHNTALPGATNPTPEPATASFFRQIEHRPTQVRVVNELPAALS